MTETTTPLGLVVPREMRPTPEQWIAQLKTEERRKALRAVGLAEVDPSMLTAHDVHCLVAAQRKRERKLAKTRTRLGRQ